MKRILVVGLGYGDEGKGHVVDWLCKEHPIDAVVRFSGGHQAGHTVVHEDMRHVFSNFGSGTLRGVPTVWDERCTFEPVGMLKEYKILKRLGVDPVIYIHPNCPVVTPYDIAAGKTGKDNMTCGVGHHIVRQRERDGCSFPALALAHHPFVYNGKLKSVSDYHSRQTSQSTALFRNAAEEIKTIHDIHIANMPYYNMNVILESSQGIMLDKDIGNYPYVSDTNVLPYFSVDDIVVVTRAYSTRHGEDPIWDRLIRPFYGWANNKDETNVENTHQGKFKTTPLHLPTLAYAADSVSSWLAQKTTVSPPAVSLVITCVDQMIRSIPFQDIYGKMRTSDNLREFIGHIQNAVGPYLNPTIYVSTGPEPTDIKLWVK